MHPFKSFAEGYGTHVKTHAHFYWKSFHSQLKPIWRRTHLHLIFSDRANSTSLILCIWESDIPASGGMGLTSRNVTEVRSASGLPFSR